MNRKDNVGIERKSDLVFKRLAPSLPLPADLASLVFSKVPPESLAAVAGINRESRQLTSDQNYWKQKYKLHFPDLFESVSRKILFDWKNEFQKAYKKEYEGVPVRVRKILSAIKESDVASLKLMDIDLEELEKSTDKNQTTLLEWAQRINNDNVLNYLYSLAVQKYSSGEALNTAKSDSLGRTILYWAINFYQSIEKIYLLVTQGSNVSDERYKFMQYSPLHIAAILGRLDVVMRLIDINPNLLNQEDKYKQTPLVWAAAKGHTEVVKYLVSLNANLEAATQCVTNLIGNNRTALHYAIANGHTDTAIALIRAGAATNRPSGDMRYQPIHLAAQEGNLDVLNALLESEADLLNQEDDMKQTPLMWTASMGHTFAVQCLISPGANLDATTQNARDSSWNNRTALHWAIERGHSDAAIALISAGAATNRPSGDMRYQPIHLAAQKGNLIVVKALLETKAGADLLNAEDSCRQTPLIWAAAEGHTEVVEYLVSRNANLEAATQGVNNSIYNNRTALHWAIANGHTDAAIALIRAGAATNLISGNMSFQPIHLAAQKGNLAVVKALLETKAESKADLNEGNVQANLLNAEDFYRQTPLIWAAAKGHKEVVEYLISLNANLEATTQGVNNLAETNRTALRWAIAKGHDDIANMLLKAGASPEVGPNVNFNNVKNTTKACILASKFIKERERSSDEPRGFSLFFGARVEMGYSKQREIAAAKAIVSVCMGEDREVLFKHHRELGIGELHAISRDLGWRRF